MKKKKKSYHRFVFDEKSGKFVGKFEEMYQHEDIEGYDSWNDDDVTDIVSQISLTILNRFNFRKILDLGCGKGAFTSLLKKGDNKVEGWDMSQTAINNARARYKNIVFEVKDVKEVKELKKKYDLVVLKEILSYLSNWKDVLKTISGHARYVFITLYIPPNPIGFVKSVEGLVKEVKKYFEIEIDVLLLNKEAILVLAKAKNK